MFQKSAVGIVCIFDLEPISEIGQKMFECLILIGRYFQRSQHAAKIGAMIPIVEKANIPLSPQSIQELKQGARPFREFKSAQAFTPDIACVPADHVTNMQLGEFI